MNRKFIGAVTAVLLAAVGTFILVSFVRGAEQRALAGEQVTQVYVVAQPIPKGTQGEGLQELLTVEQVPLKVRAAGAVTDLTTLKDKVAGVDLVPGEQLVSTRFVSPEVAAQAVDVPDGLLETTIALEPQRALGGHLQPGDTVALTASFDMKTKDEEGSEDGIKTTHMILHKVLVTNVQGGIAPPAPQGDAEQPQQEQANQAAGLMVTLALDAPSVERVVFAAEWGSVWLSDEPEDAPEDGTKIQTGATIYE